MHPTSAVPDCTSGLPADSSTDRDRTDAVLTLSSASFEALRLHSAIRDSAESPQFEAHLKSLLEHESDPNAVVAGQPVLCLAVQHLSEVAVKLLFEHGADINRRDQQGRTPFMLALQMPFRFTFSAEEQERHGRICDMFEQRNAKV